MVPAFCQSIVLSPSGAYPIVSSNTQNFQKIIRTSSASNSGLVFFENSIIKGGIYDNASESLLNFTTNFSTPGVIIKQGTNRIGIGTFNPDGKLNVDYNSNFNDPTVLLSESSSSDGARIMFKNNNASNFTLFGAPGTSASNSIFHMYHSLTGNLMTWLGDGNIGIGTATPESSLHIYKTQSIPFVNNVALTLEANSASYASMNFKNDLNDNKFSFLSATRSTVASSRYLLFNGSGSGNIMLLNDDGNVKNYNFTQLGSDAPKIKMKVFTGTLTTVVGGYEEVTTNILADKILDVKVMVNLVSNIYYPENYTKLNNIEFNYWYADNYISIELNNGNSASINGKPYKAFVTYTE